MCNPNISLTEAECGSLDSPRYVTQFHCLGQPGLDTADTEARLKDARLSFVSGHASLSTFAMWFCIVYLHQRMVSSKTLLNYSLAQGLKNILNLL